MDLHELHMLMAIVGIPLVAIIAELLAGEKLSERHHVHHDTYTLSPVVSRTLVLVMVFMGVLGGLVSWLCHLGVFATEPTVPLAFFISFQMTLFVMAIGVIRYQVMAYDDHMVVRPGFGRTRTIRYDQIDRMEWVQSFLGPRLRDMRVHTRQDVTVRLWCLLDIEQILLRIDRFETIVN